MRGFGYMMASIILIPAFWMYVALRKIKVKNV
jgi:hypothetical protein